MGGYFHGSMGKKGPTASKLNRDGKIPQKTGGEGGSKETFHLAKGGKTLTGKKTVLLKKLKKERAVCQVKGKSGVKGSRKRRKEKSERQEGK